jgi:hypothetical protein
MNFLLASPPEACAIIRLFYWAINHYFGEDKIFLPARATGFCRFWTPGKQGLKKQGSAMEDHILRDISF